MRSTGKVMADAREADCPSCVNRLAFRSDLVSAIEGRTLVHTCR